MSQKLEGAFLDMHLHTWEVSLGVHSDGKVKYSCSHKSHSRGHRVRVFVPVHKPKGPRKPDRRQQCLIKGERQPESHI